MDGNPVVDRDILKVTGCPESTVDVCPRVARLKT
jgi:hypothetical protein